MLCIWFCLSLCLYVRMHNSKTIAPIGLISLHMFSKNYIPGGKINARPLAQVEWKSRGMSRILRRSSAGASGYFNLFCQLYVPTN